MRLIMFFLIILKIIKSFAWRTVELLVLSFSWVCWSAEYDITFACLWFKFHFLDFHGWGPILQFISIVWERDHFLWTQDRVNLVFIYTEFLGWGLTECHQMFCRHIWKWCSGLVGSCFFVCLSCLGLFPADGAEGLFLVLF